MSEESLEKNSTSEKENTEHHNRKLFIWGLVCILTGAFLLLVTQNILGGFLGWWPIIPLGIGLVSLYQFFFISKQPRFIFSGMIFTLSGLLFLATIHFYPQGNGLHQTWPLFLAAFGLSYLVYAFFTRSRHQATFSIPGITMIFFAMIFSLYSFGIIQGSFTDFVIGWWPLLIIFSGLTLILLSFLTKGKGN